MNGLDYILEAVDIALIALLFGSPLHVVGHFSPGYVVVYPAMSYQSPKSVILRLLPFPVVYYHIVSRHVPEKQSQQSSKRYKAADSALHGKLH